MTHLPPEVHAYVDAANLHRGVSASGWRVDFRRFRGWLRQKYGVTRAYIFIGRIAKFEKLYADMTAAGFEVVFREVIYGHHGQPKGNCDTDLVLRALVDHYESGRPTMVLVSSDGDYVPLVAFLLARQVPVSILSPWNERGLSKLLSRSGAEIAYLERAQGMIGVQAPRK